MAFVNAVSLTRVLHRVCQVNGGMVVRNEGILAGMRSSLGVVPAFVASKGPARSGVSMRAFNGDGYSDSEEEAPPRRRSYSDNNENKLFVGNLSWGVTDTDLLDAFEQYGAVTEAKVMTDRETGRSRGFGFVTYDSPESAQEAMEALNGIELLGRAIRVSRAEGRQRSGGQGGRPRRDDYGGGDNFERY
eukprot:CAMPEP_0184688646 /NCGR_PEP_ID=MMETSP0312-20130426/30213_1 /TAXON_ID=31354 /ORGANISM="Compsopogon coeruleus, Strain SAG 36.94" /LENGTH=188 /DNA_ID=CAMNT_0027145903 /DNA_START=708 /DNA_END=1274 /DNA_ORIENTATION=-